MRLIVARDGQAVVAARIAAARPLAASILVGQPAEKAVALVPRLFSLCGRAQGAAARLALNAARGQGAAGKEHETALRDVAREAIGEHLWRLLLDWPRLLGQAARKDEFLAWHKRLSNVVDAAAAATLGADLLAWLEHEPPPSADLPASPTQVRLLPWLTAEEWAQQGIDEGFASRPTLAGQPAETGALARRSANPEVAALRGEGSLIAARLSARVADLRYLANGLIAPGLLAGWLDAAPAGDGCGLARAETARGLLLHLIEIRDDRIERYVIVAPTEWNFHPRGAFVAGIVGTPAATRAQAEASARCVALSLDPCVGYEIEVQ
ncbi:MAG: nickel-dependent hydrogenase large subunit [Betaproteobacteria bacterium]|nr:nickel-dependent hydrogenase large subunit [Betaproteobacteria bacterium]